MISKVQKDLMSLLAHKLFNQPCDIQVTNEIVKEAETQCVSLLIVDSFNILASNIRLDNAHKQLHVLLKENNIPYSILKGSDSARYYDEPILRQAGDVDFLVHQVDVDKTRELLIKNNFEPEKKDTAIHSEFKKDKIDFELHWKLNGIPLLLEEKCNKYTDTIIDNAELYNDMMLPSDFHHGIIILLHMAIHMTSGGIGLRHLCDWAVYVNKVNIEKVLKEALIDLGLWQFAQLMTMCSYEIGLPKQSWVEIFDDELVNELLDDILNSGNFGRKKETNYDRQFIGNYSFDGDVDKHSKFIQLFYSMNHTSNLLFPMSKKYKILLPFCWCYIVIRYLFRVITGKRKLANPVDVMKKADVRRNLYKQLNLFKMEDQDER